MKGTDHFYLHKEEPNKGCLLALRSILLNSDSAVTETTKWSMPCFCYKEKPFCYLWIDKKSNEPYILFVNGHLLDHPSLETGTRSKMKILKVNPNVDLQIELISNLLHESRKLHDL